MDAALMMAFSLILSLFDGSTSSANPADTLGNPADSPEVVHYNLDEVQED